MKSHNVYNVLTDTAFNTLKIVATPFFSAAYRIKVSGKENVIDTSAIFAPNHVSYFDPLFVIAAANLKKPIHFVARPMENFLWLYKTTGQIILGEGGRDAYYRVAEDVLNSGRSLGVFCEGCVSRSGKLGKFKNLAATLGIKTQNPIIPTYIANAYDNGRHYPSFPRVVEVRFGGPIYPNTSRNGIRAKSELTKKIENSVRELTYSEGR